MAANGGSYDFVIVGSGAGGGPLAANLARAGHSVLLLEAGDHHECPYYDVPLLHARASEDPDMRWDFFVHHYEDGRRRRDSKYVEDHDGVLYPRGSTLGGSTAVSAMITVYPHNSDWDGIAELTGDPSWSAKHMRPYFERLENWSYGATARQDRSEAEPAAHSGGSASRGRHGWLRVGRANPAVGSRERQWLDLFEVMEQISRETVGDAPAGLSYPLDPNDWRVVNERAEGMAFIPVAVGDGVRNGSRERVLSALREFPDRLTVRFGSLVTRVLFDDDRAVGVEYLPGAHVYRADPRSVDVENPQEPLVARARREVVLSAGAFNTPQLLKLSGIGPRAELEALGIPLLVDSPGVGENLQDRYEISVVDRMKNDFAIFDGAAFDAPPDYAVCDDPHFREWHDERNGIYSTNGSLAAYLKRSSVSGVEPDLFLFALPTFFRGYYPGYSQEFTRHVNALTWVVLKAHTNNRAGRVTLRSADPRDTPLISFRYFDEGDDPSGADLEAVIDGIELAREMSRRLEHIIDREVIPGPEARTREQLRRFVRDEAWGHHASCTAKIGADDDPTAVLDSEFRVRRVRGLRVVDASVFPRIPGFFVASAVYMVSEKASDVLLRDQPVVSRV